MRSIPSEQVESRSSRQWRLSITPYTMTLATLDGDKWVTVLTEELLIIDQYHLNQIEELFGLNWVEQTFEPTERRHTTTLYVPYYEMRKFFSRVLRLLASGVDGINLTPEGQRMLAEWQEVEK